MMNFLFATSVVVLGDSACPKYADIQQPTVARGAFDPAELEGVWYQLATTEPTMPAICKCGVNVIHMHTESGTYDYHNIDRCAGALNVSVPIKGNLSGDAATPGLLAENWAPWNTTHFKLLPNMVFDVSRNAAGAIDAVFLYACLGKLIPIVGRSKFSFNVLHRSNRLARAEIDALVAHANVTTAGMLELTGLRYNDVASYHTCGMI